jgi:UDP-glucose 4-epimerase
MGPRRMGDAAVLIAGAEALRSDTGWAPRYTDVEEVVATAFRWREANPGGYAGEMARAVA